ncbi:MAG: GNAT family N-acetyltransferase [Weeksellaceae bacterium]
MNITYREYTASDNDLLLSLTTKLDQYVKTLDPLKRIQLRPGFSELSLQDTLKDVRDHNGKIWFAVDSERLVGYIAGVIGDQSQKNKLEIGEHKLGEVLEIYLEEEYRSQGIGKTMLQMMEDYFKSHGCDSIWIDLFIHNTQALNAYRKFGFADRNVGMLKEI